MYADEHYKGVQEALVTYGLMKQSGIGDAVKPVLAGMKNFVVGHPRQYWDEINKGQLFSREGMLAKMLNPHVPGKPKTTALNAALTVGLPAYELYRATQEPDSNRGSALGRSVGGLIGGTLGMPAGLIGSMVGGTLGSTLGEGVGRAFNKVPVQAPPARMQQYPVEGARPSLAADMSRVTQRPTEFER